MVWMPKACSLASALGPMPYARWCRVAAPKTTDLRDPGTVGKGLTALRHNIGMQIQKFLIPSAILIAGGLAYRSYGWQGILVVVSFLVFGILLHFSRMMQVLKRAANRPIGHVDSAVMLNAKLKPGVTLMHVVAMTRSLGLLTSFKDEQPEVFAWKDGGESVVTCTFVGGKLAHHVLVRPDTSQETAQQP